MGRRRLLASVGLTSLLCFGMLGLAVGFSWSPHLGLDLEGRLSVVFKPNHTVANSTLQTAANIMIDRSNGLGVSGSDITTQGGDIIVQMPGIKGSPSGFSTSSARPPSSTSVLLLCDAGLQRAEGEEERDEGDFRRRLQDPHPGARIPLHDGVLRLVGRRRLRPRRLRHRPRLRELPVDLDRGRHEVQARQRHFQLGRPGYAPYVLGPALATGTIISNAYSQLSETGQSEVIFDLTGSGTTIFNKIAATYYHELRRQRPRR